MTTTETLSRISAASPAQMRPLPTALRGTACHSCDHPQASWWLEVFDPVEQDNKVYACSLCLLYETEWGRLDRSKIEEVIRRVEVARNAEFESDDSNRLISSKDGDDILGVIVLSHRASALRARGASR